MRARAVGPGNHLQLFHLTPCSPHSTSPSIKAIGGFDDDKPSYKQLEALVESARRAKLEIFALARKASSLDREQVRCGAGRDGGARPLLAAARGCKRACRAAHTAEQVSAAPETRCICCAATCTRAIAQGASPAEVAQLGAGEAAFLSPEEVTAMDPKQLRRVLVGLGLPGAGTPQKLLQRAKAVAEAAAGGASLADAVEVARRLR